MEIKVITIDFWNTLFDSSNGKLRNTYRQEALLKEIARLGKTVDMSDLKDAMQASWEFFDHIWKNDMRTPSPYETVEFFWDYLQIPPDQRALDTIVDAFENCIIKYPPSIIKGVRKSMKKLSKIYQLAIVSDTGFSPGSILRELLYKEEIFDYFSAFSFSDETGVSKPHEKAFSTVLDKLKCKPENALHIGDIEETDIKGAKNIGMKAIKFSGDDTSHPAFKKGGSTIADIELSSWKEIREFLKGENEVL